MRVRILEIWQPTCYSKERLFVQTARYPTVPHIEIQNYGNR